MLFNSFVFFIFLGIVWPIFRFLPGKTSKNVFLLLSSYIFYGYWDWRFCSLLAISTFIDFFVGRALYSAVSPGKRKKLLLVSLFSNLGILGFFKYFNFFADSFSDIMSGLGFSADFVHLNIILPVGISFYTFQTLSYTIDIYRGKIKPVSNFVDFALFVSFFPQLVAGPIERAAALLPQLSKKLSPTRAQINEGIELIVMGLFRKVMIGDTSGRYVDNIFGNLEIYSSYEIICGLLLFSVQIYADFSGYSHIARGTAKLLGVELMKNFEQPYLSRNITEFWRRWHISLSSWLKDYLYISLGGNRKGISRTYINLMLTMLLGGLWHGASWNFVIWGGMHGIYLAIHKMMLGDGKVSSKNLKRFDLRNILNIFTTYVLVLFTWLFFRSTSWNSTKVIFNKMWNWEGTEYAVILTVIVLMFTLIIMILDLCEYLTERHTFLLKLKMPAVRAGILMALFIVSLLYMFISDPLPFIYFQF